MAKKAKPKFSQNIAVSKRFYNDSNMRMMTYMTFAHDTIKNVEHDYTIVEWGIVLLSAI